MKNIYPVGKFLLFFLIPFLFFGADSFAVEKAKPLTIREKYGKALDSIGNACRNVPEKFQGIRALGKDLMERQGKSPDLLTRYNPNYWRALFEMGYDNPSIYLIRSALLMQEGLYDQAGYLLAFAHYNHIQGQFTPLATMIRKDIQHKKDISEPLNKSAQDAMKDEDYGKSLRSLEQILKIYPKDPQTIYMSIQLKYDGNETTSADLDSILEKYAQIRSIDPFFQQAYQGDSPLGEHYNILSTSINPALRQIETGSGGANDFLCFAEGCETAGIYEYALYGYWNVPRCSGKLDGKVYEGIIRSLEGLGFKGTEIFKID